ncbi:hypothetical protein [Paractinoplanes durhamensis]|uniref:Uncharacterized protein n=1 Tax=Paractinoplanes durhamensis TaxID=113563 RepID=A0ABQ3Z606_9ACTN|nr:hypothetical protein [Actinoplanes durhamensis]GIE05245.1 hypothetical protein Adu01nite_65950 [Actinoplanes durhamensis]
MLYPSTLRDLLIRIAQSGWGLGTYNAGVIAIMDDQRFATRLTCTDHQWSTGFGGGVFWPGWLR